MDMLLIDYKTFNYSDYEVTNAVTNAIEKQADSQAHETRPISMTNTDGKIFFGILTQRLENYMLSNNYIDQTIQKGFARGVPGCFEHTTLLQEAFSNAIDSKYNICATFLDLSNAFGSIDHNMIPIACSWFHLPANFADLLKSYYSGLNTKLIYDDGCRSESISVKLGLFQGCAMSVQIFLLIFQIMLNLLKSKRCIQQAYNFF